jgi:hypothetical protein
MKPLQILLAITLVALGVLGYQYFRLVSADPCAPSIKPTDELHEDSISVEGTSTVVVYDLANYDDKIPTATVNVYAVQSDGTFDATPAESGRTNGEGRYQLVKTDLSGKWRIEAIVDEKSAYKKGCGSNHVRTENKPHISLVEIPVAVSPCKTK